MRKFISSILILAISFSLVSEAFSASLWTDFNVKLSLAGDETYTTALTNISRNTDLTFQFVGVSSGGAEEYSINVPAGFTYQSSNTNGTDCAGFTILNSSNSNFHFSFNDAWSCLAKTEFTYQVTPNAAAWNSTVSLLSRNGSNWDIVSDITLGVTTTNSITKAVTKDLDSDGLIDAYLLSIASNTGITASSFSSLAVAWVTIGTATMSGADWLVPFTESLGTGDLPNITGTFDGVVLTNGTVNEEDGARPYMTKLGGVTLVTLGVGQSIDISTGSLVMEFSEPMIPSSANAFTFQLGASPVAGSFAYNGNLDRLTFTPASPLGAGSYTLSATSGVTDWSSNANAFSQTIPTLVLPDTVLPVGWSLWLGTGILINADNLATNNPSVQLQLLSTDNVGVSEMRIANDINFTGIAWENYATSKSNWNLNSLSSATGSKTVYAQFRDFAGNLSPVYSDSITYDTLLSYANFDSLSSLYINTTSITLGGTCNYISTTWAVLGTTIVTYVNGNNIGNVTCSLNRWSQTFTGLSVNAANLLRVEFTPAIASTITITNPIPSCAPIANGVQTGIYPACTFTCNAGYTKVGGACIANNCSASGTYLSNAHSYSVPFLSHAASASATTSSLSIANGTIQFSQNFTCSLGTTSPSGSETSSVSCNSGFSVSGNTCVAIPVVWGGGGWGGGGGSSLSVDNCPNGDRSGNLYDGKCGTVIIGTGTIDPGTGTITIPTSPSDTLSWNTIDMRYFLTPDDVRNYIGARVTNRTVLKLADAYRNKLIISDASYYLAVDTEFSKEYNRMLNAYAILFLRIADALSGNRSDRVKSEWKASYAMLSSGVLTVRQLLSRYVIIPLDPEIIAYRTKDQLLEKPLGLLERKILWKFQKLLESRTITQAEYDTAVRAYNDFILHLSIYRNYGKNSLAKDHAIVAIKILMTTYKKTVSDQKELTQEPQPVVVKERVGDVYTFSKDWKLGDYNPEILNLQKVLSSYGYFWDLTPTGYFGPTTRTYLIQFSKEILALDNPNGIFGASVRNAIVALELKN